MQVTTVGLDIAKNLFQVHGADAQGRPVLKRKLARGKVLEFFATLPACLIGLEACGAAHYWARELARLGHTVRLMPPQYVRPYVKANKHDAADAEACCEAVQRPGMRFVPVKEESQQSLLMLHRVREQLLKQRTATITRETRAFRSARGIQRYRISVPSACILPRVDRPLGGGASRQCCGPRSSVSRSASRSSSTVSGRRAASSLKLAFTSSRSSSPRSSRSSSRLRA